MEKHNELEALTEDLARRTRRPAAEIMVVPQKAPGTRVERLRTGGRRWVTALKAKPDLRRRFTRNFPML